MQVKILLGSCYSALEANINNWLKENSKIEIKHITQSEKDEFLVISIFYIPCLNGEEHE